MRLYLDSCVLIDALDGAEPLRSHTLQQLERFADSDWVISDLVRMECLVGPLRAADAIHLAAAVHWRCDALLTNDRAFHLSHAPIEVLRLEPDQPLNPAA
jgi:predicted nucleic acid-binding protein